MPTTPMKSPLPPPADAPREGIIGAAFAPLTNTLPFDNTHHHPAMSIPCGMSADLPVGMMLVGQHFQESLLYQVAHAFEQQEDWRALCGIFEGRRSDAIPPGGTPPELVSTTQSLRPCAQRVSSPIRGSGALPRLGLPMRLPGGRRDESSEAQHRSRTKVSEKGKGHGISEA